MSRESVSKLDLCTHESHANAPHTFTIKTAHQCPRPRDDMRFKTPCRCCGLANPPHISMVSVHSTASSLHFVSRQSSGELRCVDK
eukprot:1168135-Amorphochlora_amoeboformis.AAC.1